MITLKGMKIKSIGKKIFWLGLYFIGLLAAIVSIVYFDTKDLNIAFSYFFVSMAIYTFLVTKNLKFLSVFSFVSIIPISLVILVGSNERMDNGFISALSEKSFMITLAISVFFLIVNSIFWITTQHNWKKIISWLLIIPCFLILFTFALSSPQYHQNFVYSRIFISIFCIFSIFLIMRHKKSLRIFGVLGIFLSIAMLLFSAYLFAGKTYIIQGEEWEQVSAFIDPKAREMFEYYNQNDFNNFYKYYSPLLGDSSKVGSSEMKEWRKMYGKYLNLGEPEIIRAIGFYHIKYPVRFQNSEELFYVRFMISDISPESSILGFNISNEKSQ